MAFPTGSVTTSVIETGEHVDTTDFTQLQVDVARLIGDWLNNEHPAAIAYLGGDYDGLGFWWSGIEGGASTVTLRTYREGGDPFEDRIEFHLRNRPGVPSGFRMPNGTKDEDVGQIVDEAEIRRAFGMKD